MKKKKSKQKRKIFRGKRRRVPLTEVGKRNKTLTCKCGSPIEYLVTENVSEVKCHYCLFKVNWKQSSKFLNYGCGDGLVRRFKWEKPNSFWCRCYNKTVKGKTNSCKYCEYWQYCKELV